MKIAFKTLGCRLNQFETDSIASEFISNGFEIVSFSEKADIYVVNTCTVTNHGDASSRQAINSVTRKNPDSILVVTGCMVNKRSDNPENLKDVTYFVKNEQKTSIYNLIDSHLKGEILQPEAFLPSKFNFKPAKNTFHTRSFIKIQDGCDNFCTFCIVPMVRGRAVSRPANDIIENIKQVLDFGYKEIVLTGVNIGRYQTDTSNFEGLLERILNLSGNFRLRISSIEPDGYGDRFFDLLSHPKLNPHLHLCLQSGSDRILLQMRRMYSLKEYLYVIEKTKKLIPDFNFTTDIMVGFPGETEEDFEETVKVAKEVGFSHIHTFKYSVRESTRAARMEGQIPGKIKNERSEVIRKIAEENRISYLKTFIGKTQKVLVERIKGEYSKGLGEHFVPVEFQSDHSKINKFYNIQITDLQLGKDPFLIGKNII